MSSISLSTYIPKDPYNVIEHPKQKIIYLISISALTSCIFPQVTFMNAISQLIIYSSITSITHKVTSSKKKKIVKSTIVWFLYLLLLLLRFRKSICKRLFLMLFHNLVPY